MARNELATAPEPIVSTTDSKGRRTGTTRTLIAVSLKACAPTGGKDLGSIAAMQGKLDGAVAAFAEALGITPDEVKVSATPIRRRG